jgi:hypothetical protein
MFSASAGRKGYPLAPPLREAVAMPSRTVKVIGLIASDCAPLMPATQFSNFNTGDFNHDFPLRWQESVYQGHHLLPTQAPL